MRYPELRWMLWKICFLRTQALFLKFWLILYPFIATQKDLCCFALCFCAQFSVKRVSNCTPVLVRKKCKSHFNDFIVCSLKIWDPCIGSISLNWTVLFLPPCSKDRSRIFRLSLTAWTTRFCSAYLEYKWHRLVSLRDRLFTWSCTVLNCQLCHLVKKGVRETLMMGQIVSETSVTFKLLTLTIGLAFYQL
jgi:hypothetical protein